jgi:hypothetical protein
MWLIKKNAPAHFWSALLSSAVIVLATRSVKLGTAFATQGLLSDGLDDPAVRPTFCDTQNDLAVAEGVKEACIGCIPWPALDQEVESAAGP